VGGKSAVHTVARLPHWRKTERNLFSRILENWKGLPPALLQQIDWRDSPYGYIGVQDHTLDPIIRPGLVMPQLSGTKLAQQLAEMRPQICTKFMSGYSNNLLSDQEMTDPRYIPLQKPFRLTALGERVREALSQTTKAATAGRG